MPRTKQSPRSTLPVSQIPAVTVAPSSHSNATPLPVAATSTPTAMSSYALAAGAAADTPPDVTLPPIPSDYTEPVMTSFRGHYPNKVELAEMRRAEDELRQFTEYTTILGTATTPAVDFANALELGRAWRSLRDQSAAWDSYVKAQDAKAWKTAMAMLDDVRPSFQRAVQKNSALGLAYPALVALCGATKTVAKAAVATRAKNAETHAATAAAATKAASDTAQAAAITAANAAGVAKGVARVVATGKAKAVTRPKAVTVNA
jgi:hypothetical protein